MPSWEENQETENEEVERKNTVCKLLVVDFAAAAVKRVKDNNQPVTGVNKRQQAELRHLARWGLASYLYACIKSPLLEEPLWPPTSIPTPNTSREAMRSVDAEQWNAAIDEEMSSLREYEVADLVPSSSLPRGAKAIGSLTVQSQDNGSDEGETYCFQV